MAEQENKPQKTNDIQDYEMGSGSEKEVAAPAKTEGIAQVNPSDSAPTRSQKPEEIKGVPAKSEPTKKTPANPEARRKALLGCLGAFGVVMIIFLIISFIFIAQSGGENPNPIATLLQINEAAFTNGLITFVHIIFILISLIAFVMTMVGLFRASMAKKGDMETRKSGLRQSLISGLMLMLILIVWGFAYIYLDSKRVKGAEDLLEPIITDPVETVDLSAPIEIKFDATNVPLDPTKYQRVSDEWDFDDGSGSTGQIVSHIYEKKGTYTVRLKVTAKDKSTGKLETRGEYTTIVSITNQALSAIFSADPQSGAAPLTVKFDASESIDPDGYLDIYEWDLDDDGLFDDAEGAELEHEFEKIGKYKVSLRVTSTTGEYDVSEKEINVQEREEIEATITVIDEPEEFSAGVSYVFSADDVISPNGTVEEYSWDFGDGGEAVETKTASHVFENEGTYEVTLTLKDEEDNTGEITRLITIGSEKGSPQAVISTQPALGDGLILEGRLPFSVVFDANGTTDSDNNIVDYAWNFGDGSASAFGKSVSHSFDKEGTFTVTLSVTDADDNTGTDTQIVKVSPQGIIATLEANKIDGNVPLTVEFDASGSTHKNGQITSYKWDFGDGTKPKLGASTINHKYTEIGSYTASVEVIGADNSSDTATLTITVREIPLSACFVSVFERGPAPLETSFDPGCTTGTAASYFWNFGDGGTSTQVKPTHVFEQAGEYTVLLEVSDADKTISKANLIITVTSE